MSALTFRRLPAQTSDLTGALRTVTVTLPTAGLTLTGSAVMTVASQITLMGFAFTLKPINTSIVTICVVDGAMLVSSGHVPTAADILSCAVGNRPFGYELGAADCHVLQRSLPGGETATIVLQSCSFAVSSTATVLAYVARNPSDMTGSIFAQAFPTPTNALRAAPTVVAIR